MGQRHGASDEGVTRPTGCRVLWVILAVHFVVERTDASRGAVPMSVGPTPGAPRPPHMCTVPHCSGLQCHPHDVPRQRARPRTRTLRPSLCSVCRSGAGRTGVRSRRKGERSRVAGGRSAAHVLPGALVHRHRYADRALVTCHNVCAGVGVGVPAARARGLATRAMDLCRALNSQLQPRGAGSRAPMAYLSHASASNP